MTLPPDKIALACDLLRSRDLDGLIVYSDGSCNILTASYLQYVAGFRPIGPHAAAVLSRRGAVSLVVPAWDVDRVRRRTWIDDVRGCDAFAPTLANACRTLGISGRIGLAGGDQMAHAMYASLSPPSAFEPADDIVEAMAADKPPEEVALIRRVAAIADVGFLAFREATRVGVREYELVAETEYAMRQAGADDNFILIGSGPHNDAMRAPTDRRLEAGDIVIGEITPVVGGQFIQLCRTISIGPPPQVLVEKYDLLLRAYRAAVSRLIVGAPASVVASTINAMLADAGYREYCYPPYMRTRGHGFGVGSVMPGMVIDEDTTHLLGEYQVIVVHPNQYLPETGYLACGETFLVTSDGSERLSRTDTRLYTNET